MLGVAYVENSILRSTSKRSTALMSPTEATCTRSSTGSPRPANLRARNSARGSCSWITFSRAAWSPCLWYRVSRRLVRALSGRLYLRLKRPALLPCASAARRPPKAPRPPREPRRRRARTGTWSGRRRSESPRAGRRPRRAHHPRPSPGRPCPPSPAPRTSAARRAAAGSGMRTAGLLRGSSGFLLNQKMIASCLALADLGRPNDRLRVGRRFLDRRRGLGAGGLPGVGPVVPFELAQYLLLARMRSLPGRPHRALVAAADVRRQVAGRLRQVLA